MKGDKRLISKDSNEEERVQDAAGPPAGVERNGGEPKAAPQPSRATLARLEAWDCYRIDESQVLQAGLRRDELVSRVHDALNLHGVCVIQAQALLGKTTLAYEVMREERLEGRDCFYLNLTDFGEGGANRKLRLLFKALSMNGGARHVSLVIDDVPSMGEEQGQRLGCLVRNAVVSGMRVLLCSSPEVGAAYDALPAHAHLDSRDLIATDVEYARWFMRLSAPQIEDLRRITRGIVPLLYAASESPLRFDADELLKSSAFKDVVGPMALSCVSAMEMQEHRQLAQAMMALGHGELDDLRNMGLRIDAETAFGLAADYPLLGVSPYDQSFAVIACPSGHYELALSYGGVSSSGGTSGVSDARIVRACAHALAQRGEFARAAQLASRYLGPHGREELVRRWPCELAAHGGLALLRTVVGQEAEMPAGLLAPPSARQDARAADLGLGVARIIVESLRPQGLAQPHERMRALQAIVERRSEERGLAAQSAPSPQQAQLALAADAQAQDRADAALRDHELCAQARLMLLLRMQWDLPGGVSWQMAQDPDVALTFALAADVSDAASEHPACDPVRYRVQGEGPVTFGLRILVGTLALLSQGDWVGACRLVVASGLSLDGATSVSAALRCVFNHATRLSGDALSYSDAEAHSVALETLQDNDLANYAHRDRLLGAAIEAYAVPDANAEAERLLAKLGRRDGQVADYALNIAIALADVRRGASKRARVRARRAQQLASDLRLGFYQRIGNLVEALSLAGEGFQADAERWASLSVAPSDRGELDAVSRPALYFSAALSQKPESLASMHERLDATSCPEGMQPLVMALRDMVARVCPQGGALPLRWEQELAREAAIRPSRASAQVVPSVVDDEQSKRLMLRLLGGIDVSRAGVPVGGTGRKRTPLAVLAALATARGHQLSRERLCEIVWPDVDPVRARERLYTTLSVLRKALDAPDAAEDGYVLTRPGVVQLNTSSVWVDADELERTARDVIGRVVRGPEVVTACGRLIDLYRGDLYVPSDADQGFFAARARELRDIYVDALVSGTDTVLSSGYAREALWLAKSAAMADARRQDTILRLLQAQVLAREFREAKGVYERYARYAVDVLDVLPSKEMRRLYATALRELGETAA